MIDLIYLDNHLLIVNKQTHVVTQENGGLTPSLHWRCKEFLRCKFSKQGQVFCEPIHRLDKEASGLVIFARTSKALSRLNRQMREGKINKTYLVKVEGVIQESQVSLVHFLLKKQFHAQVFDDPKDQTKEAVLSFEKICSQDGASYLKVNLKTGRYHQIRAQLAHIGHPVCGDKKYAAKTCSDEGIALHHMQVSFFHPVTQKKLVFSAKPNTSFFFDEMLENLEGV